MHDLTQSDRASHLVIQGLLAEAQTNTERIWVLTELLSVALELLHDTQRDMIHARAAAKASRFDLQRYTSEVMAP